MSLIYDRVKVRLSELTTVQVKVPKWETAVLQAIYGDSAQVVGEMVVNRRTPTADEEFTRLTSKYGPKGQDAVPFVAAVYGNFGIGLAALGNAIRGAVTSESDGRTPQFVSEEAKARYYSEVERQEIDAEISRKAREAMIAQFDATKAKAAVEIAAANSEVKAAEDVNDLLGDAA